MTATLRPSGAEARNDAVGLARGGLINLAGAVSSGALGLVLIVIITRSLGIAGAGAFFEAIALFSILFKSAQLGADTGLVRFISRYRATNQVLALRRCAAVAVAPVAVVGSVVGALLFVMRHPLAELLAQGVHSDQLAAYLGILAPFVPVAAVYSVLEGATRGFGSMTPAVLVEKVARPLAQAILLVVVTVGHLGPRATALAWAGPYACALVAFAAWTRLRLRQEETAADPGGKAPTTGTIGRDFWLFTSPRALAGALQVTLLWFDTLLVGAIVSSRDAGMYAASARFVFAAMLVALCIAQVLQPQISQLLARRELERANDLYRTSTAWLVVCTWPVHLTLMLFAPLLLSIFGAEFSQGSTVLVVLAAAFLFATSAGPVDVVLLMGGRSRSNLANAAAALTINVSLNLLLLPRYGITGAAVAWAASVVFNNAVPLLQVRRRPGLSPYGRSLSCAARLAIGAFVPVGLVLRATLGATLPALFLYLAVGGATYLALLWRFRQPLRLDAFRDLMPVRHGHWLTTGDSLEGQPYEPRRPQHLLSQPR